VRRVAASHFFEVDYEAGVEDFEREARRMLDFLGLPWDESVPRFHETNRPVRIATVNLLRQSIHRYCAGRWKKHAAQLKALLAALNAAAD
jgi:hypothetical protein